MANNNNLLSNRWGIRVAPLGAIGWSEPSSVLYYSGKTACKLRLFRTFSERGSTYALVRPMPVARCPRAVFRVVLLGFRPPQGSEDRRR